MSVYPNPLWRISVTGTGYVSAGRQHYIEVLDLDTVTTAFERVIREVARHQ